MNKMTKGALATGLGIALLIGGGGTLAVWNHQAVAQAGTIKSGDLSITALPGEWKNANGTPIQVLEDYKVVPGDELIYTQEVTINLVGDLMTANLVAINPPKNGPHLEVGELKLTDVNGTKIQETGLAQSNSGDYTASLTVKLPDTVSNRDYVEETHILGEIGFKLEQAPVASQVLPKL